MRYALLAALVVAFLGGLLIKHDKPDYLTITFKSSTSAKVVSQKEPIRAGGSATVKVAAPSVKPTVKSLVAVILSSQEVIATQVKAAFIEDPERAVAVFRAESGLRPEAQGWNCYYNGVSTPCKPQDRPKAWSTDCGVAQLNFPGTECPAEAFNPDWNIQQAKSKYDHRGWQPWSAYNNGAYEAFLK